jgi:tetratricopeptide (TPR) repeat protein
MLPQSSSWTAIQKPGAAAPPEVPGYETLQPLGAGGMAQVFLARQRNLERLVAIKFLAPQAGADDGERRLRFEREARLMAQVAHPNVVTVFDRGMVGDRDYLVMEHVEGVSLRALLEVGAPLAVTQARKLLREVAQALAHLHGRGIVHRDVKPENVLVGRDGAVRVTDFGIAFLTGEEGLLTRTSQAVGTLDYMAPEQRCRLPVDARADQFALAVMAYELLTGRRPLGNVKPPSQLNPALGADVDPVLLKALRQDPEDRYPSVSAFAEALDDALGQASASRRRPRAAALLAAGLLVGLGAGLALQRALGPGPAAAPSGPADQSVSPSPPAAPAPAQVKAPPPSLEALIRRADEHAARGRYREAVATFDEAIRRSPNDPELFSRQGKAYLRLGNKPAAIAAFSRAVGLSPKGPLYRHQRGWAYLDNHEFAKAAQELTEAIRLDPADASAHCNLGFALFPLGQHERAIEALTRALERGHRPGYPHLVRGRAYQALKKDQEARDDFLRAVRAQPSLAEAHRALAALLVQSKSPAVRDPKQAVEHAWQALYVSKGTNWEAVKTLAHVYAAVGDVPMAIRWCKLALEMAPPPNQPGLRKLLEEYAKRAPPS